MYQLITILLFSVPVFAQTIDRNNELLWEISGNGVKGKSYLFGTLHSNDRRLFNFPDSLYYALEKTDAVVLETDVFSMFESLDTRRTSVRLQYDNTGEPYTTSEGSTQTYYGDEDGMPQFLDAYFQQYCYNSNKKFVALETTESQIELFNDIGLPELSQMKLESFLLSREDMMDLYLEGDIYRLQEMIKLNLAVYPDQYDEMIVKRNQDMAGKLDSLLKDQQLFCAVGAGHLAGREGIISLLRRKGYKVRKVTAVYSEGSDNYKRDVKSKRSYHFVNDTLGLHIEFPGKPTLLEDEFGLADFKLIYRDFGQGNSYIVEVTSRNDDIGLKDLSEQLIASPSESSINHILLDNGGEAYEGIADSYPEGIYWVRVIMSEDVFVVIKSFGGNKFMNSGRPFSFFDKVWFE